MKNKTIIMVSPFGGIGQSLSEEYIHRGWNIIGIGGANSIEHYREYGKRENFHFYEVDHLQPETLIDLFRELRGLHEQIDGMVHLTGGSIISKSAGNISLEDYRQVIDLNLTTAYVAGQEAFNWMKEKGGGNLVFFGSTTGLVPSKKKLPYAVAKAGVHILARALALEGAEFGIVSNAIAPGYVMTERHIAELKKKGESKGKSYKEMLAQIKKKNPMQGLLWPNDLIPIVDLLLSTKTITGEVISVDLGQTTVM